MLWICAKLGGNPSLNMRVSAAEQHKGSVMRNTLIGLMSLAAVIGTVGAASATEGGAAAGATTGAVAGAVVGGPVGAAVGAGVGAVAGGVASDSSNPPPRAVVVQPAPTGSVPCVSKTVRTENSLGESKTVTSERCD
jgi:hypothetical protein